MSNKVVFLDYDGVVNTPMWEKDGKRCRQGMPYDGAVNNFQAVQWVSEFCQKYGYDIVVTSTWRMDENYAECLMRAGLRPGIHILGRTPIIHADYDSRSKEIKAWLKQHPEVTEYLIFDDEGVPGFEDKLVKCDTYTGFGMREYLEAEKYLAR